MSNNQDWVGNTNSVYKIIGASNHAKDAERQIEDFYATSPTILDSFCENFKLPKNILEPCAGNGHLSEKLKSLGHNVLSYDIIERDYPLDKIQDFLQLGTMPENFDCVLTNPPYKYAKEFVLKALSLLPHNGVCAMFLKTTFLEGKERYKELFSKYPPKYVYVYSSRQICGKDGKFDNVTSSAVSYSMFVWIKGSNTEPIIRWL